MLLKTLEEPPSTTVFVVLADARARPSLVTIASRCLEVEFRPLSDGRPSRQLLAEEGIAPEVAAAAAAGAGGRLDRARLLARDPGFAVRQGRWRAVPDRLDGTGATVAVLAGELLAAADELVEVRPRQRQEDELAAAQRRPSGPASGRVPGRQAIEDRHRREQRRVRADELRAGLAALAGVYRARLDRPGGAAAAGPGRPRLLSTAIDEAAVALVRNPNETLLVQALLLSLDGAARALSDPGRPLPRPVASARSRAGARPTGGTAPTFGTEEDEMAIAEESLSSDEAFHIERGGIDHVPESERWARPRDLFGMWAGGIVNFEILIYGAVLMSFGVNFAQAVVIIVVGNLSYVLLGLASLQGPEAGTTTFVVNRAAYGQNGNRLIALFNWMTQVGFETEGIVVLVLIGEALAAKAGFHSGTPLKVAFIVVAAAIQLVLPLLGHATILKTLRVLLVPFVVLFVIMAVLTLGKVHVGSFSHGASWQTFLDGLAFIIVTSGLGWTENGNDYSRYLPRGASKPKIVGYVFAGTFVPSVLLMVLGAAVATYVPNAGANSGVTNFPNAFSSWFVVPFFIVAIFQVFAINSLDLYSSGVTLQAIGLRLRRWQAVLVDTAICCGLTAYGVFDSSFNTLLTDFVDSVIVWIAPWTAIFLVDWVLRRRRYVPAELQRGSGGLYWRKGGIHWPAIVAQLLGSFMALTGARHDLLRRLDLPDDRDRLQPGGLQRLHGPSRRRARLLRPRPLLGPAGGRPAGGAARARLAGPEVLEVPARRRPPLVLVLRAELARSVRSVGRSGHPEEGDLADLHLRIDGDRQVRDVRELQGEVAVEARVDEPRGRVDQEPEPPEARLALQAAHQVVRQGHPLEGGPEDELARMEDEGVVLHDLDELGQLLLVLLHVDHPLAVVPEDPEEAVHVEVHRGGLDAPLAEGVDDDPPGLELVADGSVGEDHGQWARYSEGAVRRSPLGGNQPARLAGVVQRQNISFPS